jgi:hypothetical protein
VGYKITGVAASNGTVTPASGNGTYTLSGVSADTTVTVTSVVDTDSWSYKADTSWYSATPTTFVLTTPAQLAGLATLVNGGNTFSGKTIQLNATATFALGGFEWMPIGGADSGNSFAGTFDGNNQTISGLNVTRVVPATTGYGLFGSVTGAVQSLTVSGTVTTNVNATGIAGVIGYTSGVITRVTNNVAVSVTSDGSSGIGGVVGILNKPATSSTVATVTESANTAGLTGNSRLGGVVGAVYSPTDGGAVVDQSYNTSTITGINTADRSYVGGVVGYSQGYIQHCYNQGKVEGGPGPYTFAGGVVGLLNGGSSTTGTAQMEDSYSTGTVTGNTYQALWGYVDQSRTVVITNVVYLNTQSQSTVGIAASSTNINAVTDSQMRSQYVIDTDYLDSDYFDQSGTDYPVLVWQLTRFN